MPEKIKLKDNVLFSIENYTTPMKVMSGELNLYICKTDIDGNIIGKKTFITSITTNDLLFPLKRANMIEETFASVVAIPTNDTSLSVLEDKPEYEKWMKWGESLCGVLEMSKNQIDETLSKISYDNIYEFDKSIMGAYAFKLQEWELKIKSTNKDRYINEEKSMDAGLSNLSNVFLKNSKKARIISVEADKVNDSLFKAISAIGIAQKIKILLPYYIKNNFTSENPLEDIIDASHIRTRKIMLQGKWYKNLSTPLLAYMKDDNRPIALIPNGNKNFIIYDPSRNTTSIFNKKMIDEIEPSAVMLYRSLPMRKLKPKDILKFTLESTLKSDWIWIIVMGIGGGLLGMVTPQIMGKIFDTIIPDGDSTMIIQIGFLMFTMALTTFSFNVVRAFSLQRIEGSTEQALQSAVWDRLLSLPISFFKKYSSGELAEAAMSVSQIRKIISGSVINTTITAIFSVFYIILLFTKGDELAYIALAVLAFVMIISILLGYIQMKYEKDMLDILNKTSGHLFGWLSGLSKIKMAGAEKRIFYNWTKRFSKARQLNYRKQNISAGMTIFRTFVPVFLSILIYFSIFKIDDFTIEAGNFIAFNSALQKLLFACLEISKVTISANVVIPLYKKVKPIFEELPEYDDQKNDAGELKGNIEISHLNFRYLEDSPLVINDVSFQIKSGEHIALVGPSGSGKSTLFRILLGFEKTESGQVFFDGQASDQLNIRSIRKQLGVVLQSGQLLTGSIFDNVVGSNVNLTQADAMQAIKKAGMEEDVKEMPMGLHTIVTEGSSTLSGGQRQRLLIARALASSPKILFFDEATSALDNITQRIVAESIDKLDATRITIAHRLSTIENCDRIIVLEEGRITEQGTYNELMELNSTFANMARRQLV